MDRENPYAPPVETAQEAHFVPQDSGGLALSEQGWGTVTSLAKWMRIVSVFLFVFGGLTGLGALAVVVGGGVGMTRGLGLMQGGLAAGGGLMLFVVAGLFILSGAWLRQSAFHFYDGVLSNAESALAQGFRKLRLFLILYGIYSLLQLAGGIYQAVTAGGMVP